MVHREMYDTPRSYCRPCAHTSRCTPHNSIFVFVTMMMMSLVLRLRGPDAMLSTADNVFIVFGLASLLFLLPPSAQSFPLAIRGGSSSSSSCQQRQQPQPSTIPMARRRSSAASNPHYSSSSSSMTTTGLNNMLRDYASSAAAFNNNNDDFFYGAGSNSNNNANNNYYDSSTNWRKNQGYNLSKPIPPELGGTVPYRDAETNPYYDPGWAQSVRRDSSSPQSSSSSQGYYYNGYDGDYNDDGRSTYPGMTNPRKTDKIYTNPTNPYYDPLWSQSYIRNDVPIRDADHTMYYAPGYDRYSYSMRRRRIMSNNNDGNFYYPPEGNRMMMMMMEEEDEFDNENGDGYYGGGGGYYGRGRMGRMMVYATPSQTSSSAFSASSTTTATSSLITTTTNANIARGGWKKTSSNASVSNGNSLMR